ncbi:TolC family protein [Hymenobacter aquaticus]|uniref:TolC family protein n=1 Tax=Hymenobacter aquaticus TaxID=1867101 RepID=A0A4Z0PXB7_9BACT|nr:TolC family protein [Hymenobacter aquaticus]TGE22357.1 TolC family protein [Hymenobacter aquaticus]
MKNSFCCWWKSTCWAGPMVLVLSLGASTQAQQRWTLPQCLAQAQQHSLELQLAQVAQRKSAAQLTGARRLFLPTIEARVRSASNWGFLVDPSTNELSNRFNFGNQAALNLSLNLFDGFATTNQLKLRRQQLAAADYDYQARANQVQLEVAAAFLQVLLAQEHLLNSRQRAAALARQEQKVKAQIARGTLSKRDLLAVQSQVAAEGLLTVGAENSAERARFDLQQLLGLPAQPELAVQPVPLAAGPTAAEAVSLAEALTAAAAWLPELRAAQTRIEAAGYARQLVRASYRPALALTGQVATRTSNYEDQRFGLQARDNLNRQLGVSLLIPLFNQLQLRTADHVARLEELAAQLSYQQVARAVQGRVGAALLECRAAARRYQALQLQYQAAEAEYRYAEKVFELGGTDAVAFGVTRSRLVGAQSELVQAKYDWWFKQQILAFYQGKPLAL